MDETNAEIRTQIVTAATDIVAAHVANNQMNPNEVPGFFLAVAAAVKQTASGEIVPAQPEAKQLVPAVPIKKSLHDDYIVSLEDGHRYKSLKRHLSTRGMTPEEYRAKWGLSKDYPMTAPNYSKQRSELAKAAGLGRGGARGAQTQPAKGRDLRTAAGGKAGQRKREPATA